MLIVFSCNPEQRPKASRCMDQSQRLDGHPHSSQPEQKTAGVGFLALLHLDGS